MQTIIVPTDFSPVSYNAVRYAIALAADLKAQTVIIYNAFQPYAPVDPELGVSLQLNLDEFKTISEAALKKMENEIAADIPVSLQVEYISDYNLITNGIAEACEQYSGELIIMGISGAGSKLEQAIIGSTAIDVSRSSEKPVIIVPGGAAYSGLKRALLAMDFKKVEKTIPVNEIKNILNATNAKLDVLHVETNDNIDPRLDDEKNVFDSLFKDYYPEYHFIKSETFTDGVSQFAVENLSDIIIVIPKKHGLFDNIFKPSHTKSLAFHSTIPIMTIHE